MTTLPTTTKTHGPRPRLSARTTTGAATSTRGRVRNRARGHRDPALAAIHARFPITPLGPGPLSITANPRGGHRRILLALAAAIATGAALTAVAINAQATTPVATKALTVPAPTAPIIAPRVITPEATGATAPTATTTTTTNEDPK